MFGKKRDSITRRREQIKRCHYFTISSCTYSHDFLKIRRRMTLALIVILSIMFFSTVVLKFFAFSFAPSIVLSMTFKCLWCSWWWMPCMFECLIIGWSAVWGSKRRSFLQLNSSLGVFWASNWKRLDDFEIDGTGNDIFSWSWKEINRVQNSLDFERSTKWHLPFVR